MKPQSDAEMICDKILVFLAYVSFGILLHPLFERYKDLVQKWENERIDKKNHT